MSSLLTLRTSLVYVLMCSLVLSGLISITTRQSDASNNSLQHSLTPGVEETSGETAPKPRQ
jgi:hypothetical protein